MKKKILCSVLICALIFSLAACSRGSTSEESYTPKLMKFPDANSYDSEESDFTRWGFVNSSGEWIIQPTYYAVNDFTSSKLAAVSIKKDDEELWGFINEDGEWIIQPIYYLVGSFQEDLAVAALEADKYGVINTGGEWVVQPEFYDLSSYKDGLAMASSDGKTNGFVNATGEWVIEEKYESLTRFYDQGYAKVRLVDGDLYGVIDKAGGWVINPNYKALSISDDSKLIAASLDGERYGFIDNTGAWIIDPVYKSCYAFSNGYAVVCNEDDLYGYINESGEYVCQPTYTQAFSFTDIGLAAGKIDEDLVWFNKEFTILEDLTDTSYNTYMNTFNYVSGSEELLCVPTNDALCGFVNASGEWVIEPKLQGLSIFNNAYIFFNMYDKNKSLVVIEDSDTPHLYGYDGVEIPIQEIESPE